MCNYNRYARADARFELRTLRFSHLCRSSGGVPCALNTVDVGIAVGSACAMAADLRVDTRVMFSAGLAAQRLDWLKGCKTVFAIPVSASSKNPFFDRKPKEDK